MRRMMMAGLLWTVIAAGQSTAGRESEDPARRPFNCQMIVGLIHSSGTAVWSDDMTVRIPAGRRAVIEMVTVETSAGGGQNPRVYVGSVAGGALALHRIPMERVDDAWQAQRQVKIYADPRTPLHLAAGRDADPGSDLIVTITLSGYYVDVR